MLGCLFTWLLAREKHGMKFSGMRRRINEAIEKKKEKQDK